jgi:alpha-glucosidase
LFQLPGEPGSIIYDYPEDFNITNATEAASAAAASASQSLSVKGPQATSDPLRDFASYIYANMYEITTATTTPDYLRTTPTPGVRNINHPPYVINHVQGDLAVHAVSPNATHHDGTFEYDVSFNPHLP